MLARLAVLASVLVAIAAAPAAPAVAAAPCPTGARCGTLNVPLDHTGATPGLQPLAYAVLPATGPRVGTIAFLSGGPGQYAIPLAGSVAEVLAGVRPSYDILFLDQRGTGDSGAVSCSFDAATCANDLGPRRPFLTTVETAKDLEDVRAALAIDKLVLLGVSYGTKVAGEYVRRFPDRTAAVVLDSAVPTEALDAVGVNEVQSLPRVLEGVCAENPTCKRTVPNVRRSLAQAAHRLQRARLRGPLVGTSGGVQTVRISEGLLLNALESADLDPVLRSELPGAVASLAHGDAAPLIHSVSRVPAAGSVRFLYADAHTSQDDAEAINNARYLATFCTEGRLPWAPDSPAAGRPGAVAGFLGSLGATTFAPFKASTVYASSPASSCEAWPPTPRPEAVAAGAPPVRTLIVSGRDDTRTPLEDAQRIAATYPDVRLLAVPYTGHSVLRNDGSGCAREGLAAFLAGGEPGPCEARTGDGLPAPLIRTLPYRGATVGAQRAVLAKGLPGRTATAVLVALEGTFHDAQGELLRTGLTRAKRLPGLRRGSFTVSRTKVVLRSVEWVTGVRVSGSVTYAGTGRLTVGGPAAAAGSLRTRKGKVDGRLGGVRIRG